MKDLFDKDSFNVKSGLKYLVTYHKITGITYLGWDFGKIKSWWVKVFYFIWQCCLFILAIYFALNDFTTLFNMDKLQTKMAVSATSALVFLLYQMGNIGYVLTVMYCFILLLLRGRKMLALLQGQQFRPEPKTERWIGIKTLIIQIGLTCTVEMVIFPLLRYFKDGHPFSNLGKVGYTIMYTFILNIKMCLIALMMYQSYSIEAELRYMTKNFTSLKQLNAIYDEVLQIQRTMKKFNKFINHFIGMSITFGSICTITYVNLLYFDTIRKIDFSIGGMSECLSLIFIICYFSNKPNHNYNKLLDKFEKLELKNTKAGTIDKVVIDFSIVNRMYSIREDLCFTALGLYKIDIKTFLSIISIIITFAVILIQTNDQVIKIVR